MKCPTVNRTLLPLKIVLFCWYGASSSLIPYMTIHMKELGITVAETAIIYTLLPVTQLLCTPLAGMIADKLGRYKDVLMLSVLSSVAFATAILFVPPVPVPRVEHPDIHLHCGPVIVPHAAVEKCWAGPCDVFYVNQNNPVEISSCSTYCPGSSEGEEMVDIRKLCSTKPNSSSTEGCFFKEGLKPLESSNYSLWIRLGTPFAAKSTCLYPLLHAAPVEDDNFEYNRSASKDLIPSCPLIINDKRNCSLKCTFTQLPEGENGTFPHINRCVRTTGNWVLTFWLYFVLRILFNVFSSICLTLLDATALAMIEAHGGHYGRQRFWAILAQAVFSPVTGFLVDLLSQHRGYMDYSPAFHSYNVLAVGTAIAVWVMSVDVPPPAENVLKNFRKLIKVPPVIVLMLVIFWLGAMWGFVESFLFWYLMDMGSPNFLLGLTLTTGAIVGLPFLHESDWFVKKVGQVNLLLIALFFYFVRFFGYSYIHDPWYCIPFEAMEAFTYHLMWVAAATYSAELSPHGLLATIQGCIGGLHYGVGRGSGSFAGGTMMGHFGARLAFRVMGIASGVMLVLYGVLHYSWLRRYDIDKRIAKTPPAQDLELQHHPSPSPVINSVHENCTIKSRKSQETADSESSNCVERDVSNSNLSTSQQLAENGVKTVDPNQSSADR